MTPMAYLVLKTGKKMAITREHGEFLWKSLHDPSGLDEEQLDKLANVQEIYLNWRNAPDEYIRENLGGIIPMALNDWSVTGHGKLIKPQSNFAWQFARRWGLWENGQVTNLAIYGMALPAQTTLAGGLAVDD